MEFQGLGDKLFSIGQTIGLDGNNTYQKRQAGAYRPHVPQPQQQQASQGSGIGSGLGSAAGLLAKAYAGNQASAPSLDNGAMVSGDISNAQYGNASLQGATADMGWKAQPTGTMADGLKYSPQTGATSGFWGMFQ